MSGRREGKTREEWNKRTRRERSREGWRGDEEAMKKYGGGMRAGRVDWGQTCGGAGLMWGQLDEGVCVCVRTLGGIRRCIAG